MDEKKRKRVNYGNWVSKRFIYIPAVLAAVFLVLANLSPFFLIGTFFFLIPAVYFIYAYIQFAPWGGDLQVKIRELIFDKLAWGGEGELLDIGCGNGALAIEAARKYHRAMVTGIDYWGGKWEYSKKTCEQNARIAGVAKRTSFEKASASNLPFPDGTFDAAVSNFVFHEVQDAGDKREVIKEALRVVKKGGVFVFQDLFMVEQIYGRPQDLLATIKSWGIEDVALVNTSGQPFIPELMKLPFMVGQIGIIHGKK